MDDTIRKQSYTIPCSSAFRDAVMELAHRRRVNVADLARSVVLVVPEETIATYPDPGEPGDDDRETVVLKSGNAKGRPWRRKPRLQVRLSPGYEVTTLRRALGMALALGADAMTVRIGTAAGNGADVDDRPAKTAAVNGELLDEMERLRTVVSALSFDPLPEGVNSRADALHVLGFPPGRVPSLGELRARFRLLATIHHPDSGYGNHRRMSQLNSAMALLRLGGV